MKKSINQMQVYFCLGNIQTLLIQITMYNDIEQVINDNLSLKKAYYVAKNQSESQAKQLKEIRQRYNQLQDKLNSISDQNSRLHQKNKILQAQINNISMSYSSQIEELKSLIQQKQNELQNFQLKLIPSLDQDMLRVKLIAEMEGPYQEQVDKRDRQISKLKDSIHQLKRQKQMCQFTLDNKERQLKKQIQEQRVYYTQQIDRLTKQLSHLSQKSSSGKSDRQLMKAYRNQIDQLRVTSEFHKSVEQQLRKQLVNLRLQRERLLSDLSHANAQKALQIKQITNNQAALKQLRDKIYRLEDQLQLQRQQLERNKNKYKSLQAEKKKLQSKYQSQIKELKGSLERQISNMRDELRNHEDQIRKYRQYKNRSQQSYRQLAEKYKIVVNSQDRLSQQNNRLKIRLGISQSVQIQKKNIHSEDHSFQQRAFKQKLERQLREKIERQIRIRVRQQVIQQFNQGKQQPYVIPLKPVRPDPYRSPQRQQQNYDPNIRDREIKALQEKIRKLTLKLQFANKKILQLLKEKAGRGGYENNRDIGRHRSISSPQHQYNHLLLQNRDCSFVPMCPPFIITELQSFDTFRRF